MWSVNCNSNLLGYFGIINRHNLNYFCTLDMMESIKSMFLFSRDFQHICPWPCDPRLYLCHSAIYWSSTIFYGKNCIFWIYISSQIARPIWLSTAVRVNVRIIDLIKEFDDLWYVRGTNCIIKSTLQEEIYID